MTTLSKTAANSRSQMLMLAVVAAAFAAFVVLGESSVLARGAGDAVADETKTDKVAVPGDAAKQPDNAPCAKPVRVIYGGYGEYACAQKTAL